MPPLNLPPVTGYRHLAEATYPTGVVYIQPVKPVRPLPARIHLLPFRRVDECNPGYKGYDKRTPERYLPDRDKAEASARKWQAAYPTSTQSCTRKAEIYDHMY